MAPLDSDGAGSGSGGPAPSGRDVPALPSPRVPWLFPQGAPALSPQVLGRVSEIPIPKGDDRGHDGDASLSFGAPSFSLAAARGSLKRKRGFGECCLLSGLGGHCPVAARNEPQHISHPRGWFR